MKRISPKINNCVDDFEFFIFNKIWFRYGSTQLFKQLTNMEMDIRNQIQRTKIK